MMMGHDDHAADNRDGPMSDNGATQFCTHTDDNTICDQCMGRPDHLVDANKKVPEPWKLYWTMGLRSDFAGRHIAAEAVPVSDVYLAAPVEAWAKEIEAVLKQLSFAAQITGGTAGRDENSCAAIAEAQRLLANWPIKETR